jgi:hypothetical protein
VKPPPPPDSAELNIAAIVAPILSVFGLIFMYFLYQKYTSAKPRAPDPVVENPLSQAMGSELVGAKPRAPDPVVENPLSQAMGSELVGAKPRAPDPVVENPLSRAMGSESVGAKPRAPDPVVESPLSLNFTDAPSVEGVRTSSPKIDDVSNASEPEEEWAPVTDKTTGKIYWWNKKTGETTDLDAPKPGY